MQSRKSTLLGCWALLAGTLAVAGCDGVATTPTSTTVAGLVLSDDVAHGTVSLRDSSSPPQERSTLVRSNGAYAIDLTGLKAPFVLQAQVSTSTEQLTYYAIPGDEIATNLSPFSTTAVAALTQSGSPEDAFFKEKHEGVTSYKALMVLSQLRTVLKPLFDRYQVPDDWFGDDGMDSALRALLRDITVTTHHGQVTVTNRATGAVIFQGSLFDLSSGKFYPENMPPGPGSSQPPSTDGAALYAATCAKCHGALPGDVGGSTASAIRGAINSNKGGMWVLHRMTDAQLAAIASALSSTTPPTTCTSFTYSTWGDCQASGTQSRTVVSASPAGCTGGSPVLSQACTYVPPANSCTSFTYSAWGACQSNGTQSRTVTASSPSGCSGGSPVLTQSCTYVPPVTTCTSFTYSAWGTCTNGAQTRTVTSSSPSGCTGGTPVLSQACSSIDGAALYQAKCSSCHGALASSEKRGASASTIVGKHGTKYGTAAEMQAIADALK